MLTSQELIQEHVKEQCRYCTLRECDGIRVTIDGKTRCARGEYKNEMFKNK